MPKQPESPSDPMPERTRRTEAEESQGGVLSGGVRAIVGIAASAGGLAATRRLLSQVPPGSGLAFVVIQHLDPTRASHTAQILAGSTQIPVVEAGEGMRVLADRVHVIPPGFELTLRGGQIHLEAAGAQARSRHPADAFFGSLAEQAGDAAIGVVLSGAGNDGAAGLRLVKERGGIAIAQDPQSCESDGMPTSAVATGVVDFVAPPEEIADILLRASAPPPGDGSDDRGGDELLEQVLRVLREELQQDFRRYKRNTLRRRVQRRMLACRMPGLAEYLELLRQHRDEALSLARDLVITVTSFFREPEAFEALEAKVLRPLLETLPSGRPLRIWVPGCSTGEEAYSIAIVVMESMQRLRIDRELQIFATDRSPEALDIARAGSYPGRIADQVGPTRLRRFFTQHDSGSYQVVQSLRNVITFAEQNLIGDPPFSKLDLISCRNVLIYLESAAQDQITALFHFALNPVGFLFLGPSETTGPHADLFEAISKRWRIYRRIETGRRVPVDFPYGGWRTRQVPRELVEGLPLAAGEDVWSPLQQQLLEHFGAAAALIDSRGRIQRLAGSTDTFLVVPSGELRLDLFSLAREELRSRLRAAVRRAVSTGRKTKTRALQLRRKGSGSQARVTVIPLGTGDAAPRTLLAVFEVLPRGEQPQVELVSELPESEIVGGLERELQQVEERLQTTIEEMKAAHEEVVSTNEELQSSNEELETSKEELQSLNEELTTVNNQLQENLLELESAHADTANLLRASDTVTLFLDQELKIRRFTEATRRLINVLPGDLGRSLQDISWRFQDEELIRDARRVMASEEIVEKEVEGEEGRWFLRRILPYRQQSGEVAGVVVTLSEVTRLKQAEEHWRRLAAVLSDSNDALTVQGFDGRIHEWNHAAQRMYGYSDAEVLGRSALELIVPHDQHAETLEMMKRLEHGEDVPSFEAKRVAKDGRELDVWLTVTALRDRAGNPVSLATTERDVTERRHAEQALQASERFANAIFDTSPVGIQVFGPDGTFERMNAAQRELPPLPQADGEPPLNVLAEGAFARTALGEAMREAFAGRIVNLSESTVGGERRGRRSSLTVEQTLFPLRDSKGKVLAVVSLCHDVTERREARDRDAQRLESLGILAGGIAHDFNNLLAALLGHIELAAMKVPPTHAIQADLGVARKAIDRAADLTRQMLAYSGRSQFLARSLDFSALVQDNLRLLQAALPKRVELSSHLTEGLPPVVGDPGQLQQVVMNLVTNAAEATAVHGGVVTVETRLEELGSDTRDLSELAGTRLSPGPHVLLEVHDEGVGMDRLTVERIFDPFFTTKAAGRGLGLSAVLGIVKAHQGGIAVITEEGRGTTFRVAIPVSPQDRAEAGTAPAVAEARPAHPDGVVLVIDDEEMIRRLSEEVLAGAGIRALLASDGAEGVATYRQHADEVALVLLDLSMPGLLPAETLRQLRAINPDVKVLVTSGFAEPEALEGLEGVVGFLAKPSPPSTFIAAITSCMGAGDDGRSGRTPPAE